jgi:hypothetical protein
MTPQQANEWQTSDDPLAKMLAVIHEQVWSDKPDMHTIKMYLHGVTLGAAALTINGNPTVERLTTAIQWALGEGDEFKSRGANDGAYYWRIELRRRAGL